MKKLVLNIGMLLLTLLGGISCNIKEDMSDCPGRMILDYSAYSDVVLDDISADEQIDVFIFDADNICCDVLSFTYGQLRAQGFEFKLPIEYRGLNAVVWQGLDSENYQCRDMALGKSAEDFYLQLITDSNSYEGVPDPLWASPFEPIEYCAKITRHRVYMTRLHTEVRVTLQEEMADGTYVDLDAADYTMKITAEDNIYHRDFTIDEGCCATTYLNEDEEVGALRLTPDMECVLSIDGVDRKIDLIEYMLATKTDEEMSDQRFLDLNKIWDIKIVVKEYVDRGYIAVCMKINGWVVWFSSSELS